MIDQKSPHKKSLPARFAAFLSPNGPWHSANLNVAVFCPKVRIGRLFARERRKSQKSQKPRFWRKNGSFQRIFGRATPTGTVAIADKLCFFCRFAAAAAIFRKISRRRRPRGSRPKFFAAAAIFAKISRFFGQILPILAVFSRFFAEIWPIFAFFCIFSAAVFFVFFESLASVLPRFSRKMCPKSELTAPIMLFFCPQRA